MKPDLIRVTVQIHKNYVTTKVRPLFKSSMSYDAYCRVGLELPLKVLEATCVEDVVSLVRDKEPEDYSPVAYLDGFEGFFELKYALVDMNDVTNYVVEHARYVNPSVGGKDIRGAFRDPKFKKLIHLNLLRACADKDVEKLHKIIDSLIAIGG